MAFKLHGVTMTATVNNFPLASAQKAASFYSFVVNIDDDSVYSWEVPDHGFLLISNTSTTHNAIIWFRETSSIAVYAGSNFDVLIGSVLTGTTGADAKASFSTSASSAYLENRSGAAKEFTVTCIAANDLVE